MNKTLFVIISLLLGAKTLSSQDMSSSSLYSRFMAHFNHNLFIIVLQQFKPPANPYGVCVLIVILWLYSLNVLQKSC